MASRTAKEHHKRHHRARGGAEHGEMKPPKGNDFAGGESYVAKEAGMKKGGVAHKKHHRSMEMHGAAAHKRLDRPGRKRGGGVGADAHPLSSAANLTAPSKAAEDD